MSRIDGTDAECEEMERKLKSPLLVHLTSPSKNTVIKGMFTLGGAVVGALLTFWLGRPPANTLVVAPPPTSLAPQSTWDAFTPPQSPAPSAGRACGSILYIMVTRKAATRCPNVDANCLGLRFDWHRGCAPEMDNGRISVHGSELSELAVEHELTSFMLDSGHPFALELELPIDVATIFSVRPSDAPLLSAQLARFGTVPRERVFGMTRHDDVEPLFVGTALAQDQVESLQLFGPKPNAGGMLLGGPIGAAPDPNYQKVTDRIMWARCWDRYPAVPSPATARFSVALRRHGGPSPTFISSTRKLPTALVECLKDLIAIAPYPNVNSDLPRSIPVVSHHVAQ